MALRPRQVLFYTDVYTSYRSTAAVITSYGPKAITIVNSAKPCKLFTTPNFDDTRGGFSQHKESNVMTANKLHVDAADDVQDGDYFHITTGPAGVTKWFRANGEPETRFGVANRSQIYLVPDTPTSDRIH